MNSKGLRLAREKMLAAGVDAVAIDVFAHYYRQIEHGETGIIAESSIERRIAALEPNAKEKRLPIEVVDGRPGAGDPGSLKLG